MNYLESECFFVCNLSLDVFSYVFKKTTDYNSIKKRHAIWEALGNANALR